MTTVARYVKCTGTLNAEDVDKFGVPSELLVRDARGREYRIAKDEIGAATVLVAAKVSAAMILAAGLWDPVLQRL